MSFNEVLAELPALSVGERQLLVRWALDLDDAGLSPNEEVLVEKRLAEHHRNPAGAVSLEAMNARLRARLGR